MKNRVTQLLQSGKGDILSVYYTAGFPLLKDTVPIAEGLALAGADIIEIGIPFSDPVADGPTIQASNKVALDNGMTVRLLLEQISDIRLRVQVPIILMGYLNPILQYGVERFIRNAAQAGVDGLILPDLPLYEYEERYKEIFEQNNMSHAFLIAPTTSESRIRHIDTISQGFIYAVSSSSTTGARDGFDQNQIQYFEKLQRMQLRNPLLIGFGISNHDSFSKASSFASGAIVGSAFIKLLSDSKDFPKDIQQFVKNLRGTKS